MQEQLQIIPSHLLETYLNEVPRTLQVSFEALKDFFQATFTETDSWNATSSAGVVISSSESSLQKFKEDKEEQEDKIPTNRNRINLFCMKVIE